MANVRSGNTFYVDTSSSGGTATSYISDLSLKVVGVVFTANATTDVVAIYDKANGSAAAGSQKLKLIAATAGDSRQIRLENTPLVFPNGIWVTLTGSPTCTLILSTQSS